jgi:hypothetical protein
MLRSSSASFFGWSASSSSSLPKGLSASQNAHGKSVLTISPTFKCFLPVCVWLFLASPKYYAPEKMRETWRGKIQASLGGRRHRNATLMLIRFDLWEAINIKRRGG